MSNRIRRAPWRDAATWLCASVLAVATLSVLLDGGRPAFAADECQYGPYGPYGPYAQYGPYGQPCAKARPTLTILAPGSAAVGTTITPFVRVENGDRPTGSLFVRLHRPGEGCANPSQPPLWLSSITIAGNGVYSTSGFLPPPVDAVGRWTWSATYVGDARNELTSTVCGVYTTEVTRRVSGIFLNPTSSVPVGTAATVSGGAMFFRPSQLITLRVFPPGDPSCSGSPAFSRQVSATFFNETIGPLDIVGSWRVAPSYPGDPNNAPVPSACRTFPVLDVTKAVARLEPFVSSPSTVVGQSASAGVSLVGYRPTGSLTVRVFAPGDAACSSAVESRVFTISGTGPYAVAFTPTTAGIWQVTASYAGDEGNSAALLACGSHSIVVVKAVPTLTVEATPASAKHNSTLDARLTLDGGFRPTGTVDFRLFDPLDTACTTPIHEETVALNDGVARTTTGFQLSSGSGGTWNWTATYSGDAANASRATACGEASVVVTDPGIDPAHTAYRFASGTTWAVYRDYPGEGSASTELGTAQLVCLSAAECPAGATNYGSVFGGAWTSNLSSIPGAGWIWRPGVTGATPEADFDRAVFARTFVLAGRPTSAWIEIAADDAADVRVNGELVGSIGGGAYGSLTRFDLLAFVKPGNNTIAIRAVNGPWCGTCPFSQNPAGVVFGGTITVG